jgi:hypothetical protein
MEAVQLNPRMEAILQLLDDPCAQERLSPAR